MNIIVNHCHIDFINIDLMHGLLVLLLILQLASGDSATSMTGLTLTPEDALDLTTILWLVLLAVL